MTTFIEVRSVIKTFTTGANRLDAEADKMHRLRHVKNLDAQDPQIQQWIAKMLRFAQDWKVKLSNTRNEVLSIPTRDWGETSEKRRLVNMLNYDIGVAGQLEQMAHAMQGASGRPPKAHPLWTRYGRPLGY